MGAFCLQSLVHVCVLGRSQIWGGSRIDMVYVYVPAFWGAISRNLV